MTKSYRMALSALAMAAALAGPAAAVTNDDETLIMALSGDILILDPHMSASVASDLSLASQIYPSLVIRGPDLKLKANAATAWEAVDDLTWRFTLNPNAVFENGEKLDAEAVKANIARVQDPERKSRIASWFNLISDVTVIDAATVELKTSAPYPALADQMSMFFLLPPKWASENDPAKETMSGGPYRITERVPGSSITLEANPTYWGEKPAYDKVVIQVIPEDAARVAALIAGEVDYADKLPVTEISRIDAMDGISAGAVASTRTAMLMLNTEKPPFDNKLVRQALNYAIDKDAISETLFDGLATVSQCQWANDLYFGFNPSLKAYPYDPEKAAALLAESGIDLSQEIVFEVPLAVYIQGEEVAQAAASMLEELGLKIRLSEMSFGSYMDKRIKAHDMGAMSLLTYAWPTLDADGLLSLTETGNPNGYWSNAEFDKLLAEGRSSTNPDIRRAAYDKAAELMCEEAPVVFMYEQPVTYGISDKVVWQARGDDWKRASDFLKK